MKYLAQLFLMAITLFSSGVFAKEFSFLTIRGKEFVILREEVSAEAKVYVDGFVIRPGKLQERLFLESFSSKEAALRFAKQYQEENELKKAELPREKNPPVAAPSTPVTTEVDDQVVWKVTNQWSWEWEQKYAEWVKATIDVNFFFKNNIRTDCADVAIGARWIFARINGLPAANQLSGSRVLISQDSMREDWKNLKRSNDWRQDQVFLAALDYVLDATYTRSLILDSYPIAIRKENMLPGTHHLEFHTEGGHTLFLVSVNTTSGHQALNMVQSTVPREVRKLEAVGYFRGEPPTREEGFLRLRWPRKQDGRWVLLGREQHPGYSDEQYKPEFMSGFTSFATAVKARLSQGYDYYQDFAQSLQRLRDSLKARMNSVERGWEACQSISCSPGTPGWEEWSTPVRDARLKDLCEAISRAFEKFKTDKRFVRAWNDFARSKEVFVGNKMVENYSLVKNVLEGKLNSDPRVDIEKRWGF